MFLLFSPSDDDYSGVKKTDRVTLKQISEQNKEQKECCFILIKRVGYFNYKQIIQRRRRPSAHKMDGKDQR